jgi:hypothetical protein
MPFVNVADIIAVQAFGRLAASWQPTLLVFDKAIRGSIRLSIGLKSRRGIEANLNDAFNL